jgi:hypothetical protein
LPGRIEDDDLEHLLLQPVHGVFGALGHQPHP